MAARPGRPAQPAPPAVPRQNEYFVPRDGIDREVITADICRYLGNDALVRPGTYENTQGYFITAYRNLTSAMIEDLKADSARWELERRAQQSSNNRPGPAVPYRNSNTFNSRAERQYPHHEPDAGASTRYPGSGYGGYTGVSGGGGHSGHFNGPGPGFNQYQGQNPPFQPPPESFSSGPMTLGNNFPHSGPDQAYAIGANFPVGSSYQTEYGSNAPARDRNPPGNQSRMPYPGSSQQPNFPPTSGPQYYPPSTTTPGFVTTQTAMDPFYGRGGGGNAAYNDRTSSPSQPVTDYTGNQPNFSPPPYQETHVTEAGPARSAAAPPQAPSPQAVPVSHPPQRRDRNEPERNDRPQDRRHQVPRR